RSVRHCAGTAGRSRVTRPVPALFGLSPLIGSGVGRSAGTSRVRFGRITHWCLFWADHFTRALHLAFRVAANARHRVGSIAAVHGTARLGLSLRRLHDEESGGSRRNHARSLSAALSRARWRASDRERAPLGLLDRAPPVDRSRPPPGADTGETSARAGWLEAARRERPG